MAALKNPKDERFAQLVAQGKSQSDAYREAYNSKASDKTVWENASKKAAKVEPRVTEIRQMAERKAVSNTICTINELKEGLSHAFRDALNKGDLDGMVKVATVLGKWSGAEAAAKIEVRNGGVTDDYRAPPHLMAMDDEELARLVTRD